MSDDPSPLVCRGCRWGQVGRAACYRPDDDHDDLPINRIIKADYDGDCPVFEAGTPKPKPKPTRAERERAELQVLLAERRALIASRPAEIAAAEQRGAERERAAIVAYLCQHRDAADRRGGQHVGTGPNPAVERFVRMECESIERGAHLLGPGGVQ
jgi:hypothetical protein